MTTGDKSQFVRLVDVFALGPFMVWVATQKGKAPTWAWTLLLVAGVLTVAYNGRNWLIREGKL